MAKTTNVDPWGEQKTSDAEGKLAMRSEKELDKKIKKDKPKPASDAMMKAVYGSGIPGFNKTGLGS